MREGVAGLFSGVHYRTMKSSLHSGLYLMMYEHLLRELEGRTSFF